MNRNGLIFVLGVVFLTLCVSNGFAANATIVDGVGAKSMGMGGAFTAIADDTSSMYHNPAGIARQEERTIEMGLNLMYPRPRYDEAANPGEDAKKKFLPLLQVGFVNRQEGSNWGWGLGAFTAAGLKAEYDLNHTTFGNQPYELKLSLNKIVPAIAYKITPELSFGAGLNIGIQEFDLALPYVIQTGVLAGTSTLIDVKTSGEGFGGIFGLLYEIDDKTTIGLTYTTKMDVDLQGKSPLTTSIGLSADYDVNIDYHWPQTMAVGLAHRLTPKLLLSSEVVWTTYLRDSIVTSMKECLDRGDQSSKLGVMEVRIGATTL